jgi:hypothetical protein
MRKITSMTDIEALEIGNLAFRKSDWRSDIKHPIGGEPYHSKKWRLHLFGDDKIAIVDEHQPITHIDDLYYSDDSGQREPVYNWIEIDKHLVITHVMSINNFSLKPGLLNINCQYWIYEKLIRFGFFGEECKPI